MTADLLAIKQHLKKKKPHFRRVEKHRRKALPDNWRKPKGHHSKIRRGKRWEMNMPNVGRRTPIVLRNLDKLGREFVMIFTLDDVKSLNKNNIGIVARKLGLKKKAIIAKEVKDKNFNFLNFKPLEVLKKVEEMLKSKKLKAVKVKKVVKEEKIVKPTKAVKPVKAIKPTKAVKPTKKIESETK